MEDSAVRARCGSDRTLRIERILVSPPEWTPSGAVTSPTFHFASDLNDLINLALRQDDRSLSCVRGDEENCFIVSPLSFFPKEIPLYPHQILESLNNITNITISGVPADLSMVLASRTGSYPPIEHVSFLALTYFFIEKDCLNQEGHRKWLNLLEQTALRHFEAVSLTPFVVEKARYLALQYDPTLSRPSHFNLIFVLSNIAIIGIFYSLSGSLRRMTGVHSRFGLACTAAVECCASTLSSISVCSLAGLRLTMVPW